MKRYIPIDADRDWIDKKISGEPTDDSNTSLVMWWVTLSPEMRENVIRERRAEKKADKLSSRFSSTFILIFIIIGAYLGNQLTTNTLFVLFISIGTAIVGIVVSGLIMLILRRLVFKHEMKKSDTER